MNRRDFLNKNTAALRAASAGAVREEVITDPPETVSRYANKALPTGLSRATSTLTPYTGPWGYAQAAHLLRRCLFGPTRPEILAAAGSNLTAVLNTLLTVPAAPAPPVNVSNLDTSVPIGQTWINQPYNLSLASARGYSLRDWWTGQMITQGVSLSEKMTLFWHNHFVVELLTIDDIAMSYEYCRLLRHHALGNIRQLAKDVTVTPAMLVYLGGNRNTAASPNENYGRELLELFTVGKGPLIGPGNYTNYTEDDVQAAAKVLTGWRDQSSPARSYFTASLHDNSVKVFSAALGNATIAPNGATEYQDLVNLLFQQAETARFIVRKLYRWFVYYVIDAQVETDIIQPLATLLISSNYEVAPVLRALLGSEHFFDVLNVGCLIKSPLDFTVGLARQTEMVFPPASNPVALYSMWEPFYGQAELLQQNLGDPPSVSGWPAYYQTPQYYEMWINAVTLPRRNNTTDFFINPGLTRNGYLLQIDPVALALAMPAATATDCNLLIAEFVRLLMPIPLTANQLVFLKGALLPGLPDFEWAVEWQDYLAAPTNTTKKGAVTYKLRSMLRSLMGMAEYHLS